MPELRTPTGATITVSETAWENVYSKQEGYERIDPNTGDIEEEETRTDVTEEEEDRELSDREIRQLYEQYGFEEPDPDWVRRNLPTNRSGLTTVLQQQKQRMQQQTEQEPDTGPTPAQTDTSETVEQEEQQPNRQFYRIGNNMYDAETDALITPQEWQKNWSGQAQEIEPPAESVRDKQIYQDPDNPDDLYYKKGDRYYKIRSQDQLENLVGEGYIDSREPVPEGALPGNIKDEQTQEQETGEAEKVTEEALKRGDITQRQKETIDWIAENMPEGVEEDPEEILNTFEQIKEETIDPYYQEMIEAAAQDFRDAYEFSQQRRDIQRERLGEQREEDIEEERERLEEQGLTFSGEAVEQLGKESAYPGQQQEGAVPEQELPEGEIPQEARLRASSARTNFQQQMQNLGRKAEDYLGTEEMEERGLLDTIPFQEAGVSRTAQLEQQRQEQEAAALSSIINNYAQRQAGVRNTQFNFNQ